MVEHRIVDPGVVGSSPTSHPITQCGPLAQLVEQLTLNQWVEGSNPLGPTIFFLLLITRHNFLTFQNEGKLYSCESGGIGRRTRLRIWRATVGVRVPPFAPETFVKTTVF